MHKSVKRRTVVKSGACTARQDDVLYSVLTLGFVAVDTVLSVWTVRDEDTVDTGQEPTKL